MEDSIDLVNEPSSQHGNKYEVFLSFGRGEDIQESFPSRLYSSLRKAGISVLKNEISTELLLSIIERSKISIIIFSIYYASSKMCLEELTKIMEFHRAHDHVVLPIFFDVDPYEVRDQESSFGEAFRGLIQRIISPTENEISRWRTALSEAGGIQGFVVTNFEQHNNESELIQNIVDCVRYILDGKGPFDTDDIVGVSSQVQEVITMLEKHKSKDVVSLGLWGMGGLGKTTIARLIFLHAAKDEFETTCFLSSDKDKSLRIDTHDKKALIVVDGVNHLEELDAFRGSHARFGKGSRIIITTRDSHILKAFEVDLIYSVKPFRDHESLQLLSRTAFGKQELLDAELIKVCRRMVAYTEGLPIALKVLGSIMRGKSPRECESVLMKLSTDLPHDIDNTLKLSFDSLDDNQKEMFINIVLFHIGKDIVAVTQKLDGSGCDTSIGIRALVDRSLVTIDKNNKLRMHNMLQVMGRRIIRQSSGKFANQDHMYEVFLSFRGEDTRAKFTSHLYTALCNAGIVVFKDDIELSQGDHIKLGLLHAIGNSKIAIIVFSKKYAGSRWCLEELSTIMEFHILNDQVVLPVFYDADPSEIRNQTSDFGEAFKDLIQRISPSEGQVSRWRTALAEAAGRVGFVVCGSRDESKNVKDVVDRVCDILDKKDLFVTEHPVGLDNRVQEVITMLHNHQSRDVIMVGIWGMGGLGKTTIAKAIYNEIGRKFEGRSYLSKIRKAWNHAGKVSLQSQLLSDICKTKKMEINSIESGKIILRDRLCHKKALVVLDDVDKPAQLKALVGRHDWFKPGSVIIITTRNKSLLPKRGCHVYTMKNLNEKESIKLFSWHAFKQESPREDFDELSRDIVAYSGGLPLALEVIGSHLFEREMEEWKSVLEKLKKIPNDKVQKKLKISFDGLNDTEQDIFLDISCFLIGMDKNDVTQILNGCGFFANIGIKTLMERSLVTIDEKNKLGMHDLLRDMGREIVREKSQKELGKRSRLWSHEDALVVLSEHMGTDAIEGLSLKSSQSKKRNLQTEAFKKMKRLRLLSLENVHLKGDYQYINRDLKWLCWHGFPVKYIPSNFYQEQLVAIDIQSSSLRQMWKEPQLLEKLKILNLSHSPYLVQTPDFLKLPNLETLILKDCPNLSMIHHSIGLLHKLLLLDLEDCIGLHSVPRSIYRLKCLKTVILSGCMNIEKLEEDIEQMESLTTLIAPTIKQVPFCLGRLKSISYLSLCGHEGLSHHVISSLFRCWVSPTNNPLALMKTHAGIASSFLYAGMPSSFLWNMLNNIHGPLTIPSSGSEIPDSLYTTTCMDVLTTKQHLERLFIQIGKNVEVVRALLKKFSQGLNPGDNYPYWIAFEGEGNSVKFKVPLVNGCDDLKGMTICCACFPSDDSDKARKPCIISLMFINYTKTTTLEYKEDKVTSLEEAEREEIISNLESNNQVEVKAIFGNGFIVKKTTVYLIYNESFEEEIEPSTSEAKNLTSTKHKYEEDEEEAACQSIRPRKTMKI